MDIEIAALIVKGGIECPTAPLVPSLILSRILRDVVALAKPIEPLDIP